MTTVKIRRLIHNLTANEKKRLILERVHEESIFKHYFPITSVFGKHKSFFRQDNNPGCSFYYNDNNRLIFHDFAEDKKWDCFGALMEKFGLTFDQAITKVYEDFNVELLGPLEEPPVVNKPKYKIQIEVKKFTANEIEYWKNQGVSLEQLKKYNIYSVAKVFVENKLRWRSTDNNPIFGFVFNNRVKCYRPLSKDPSEKWISNTKVDDINGYDQLPFLSDTLIITKSMKDVMVLDSFGYAAVAPQGEANKLTTEKWNSLVKSYDKIIIFYDNDEAGLNLGRARAEELGMPYTYIPYEYMAKDISQFYSMYGPTKTKELLKTLLTNNENDTNSN